MTTPYLEKNRRDATNQQRNANLFFQVGPSQRQRTSLLTNEGKAKAAVWICQVKQIDVLRERERERVHILFSFCFFSSLNFYSREKYSQIKISRYDDSKVQTSLCTLEDLWFHHIACQNILDISLFLNSFFRILTS